MSQTVEKKEIVVSETDLGKVSVEELSLLQRKEAKALIFGVGRLPVSIVHPDGVGTWQVTGALGGTYYKDYFNPTFAAIIKRAEERLAEIKKGIDILKGVSNEASNEKERETPIEPETNSTGD